MVSRPTAQPNGAAPGVVFESQGELFVNSSWEPLSKKKGGNGGCKPSRPNTTPIYDSICEGAQGNYRKKRKAARKLEECSSTIKSLLRDRETYTAPDSVDALHRES